MADKPLKSLKFPGLGDKYTVPTFEVDPKLTESGNAADAYVTGALFDGIVPPVSYTVNDRDYINKNNGGLSAGGSANWKYTDFIDISQYDSIVFTCPTANGETTLGIVAAIAFYSTASVSGFISAEPLINGTNLGYELSTVSIPSGANYARTSIWAASDADYLFRPVREAGSGGGGGSITVDSALSSSSTNPVQNKVINTALGNKISAPSSPTSGQFLVYDGSAWTAQTLSTWAGGSY